MRGLQTPFPLEGGRVGDGGARAATEAKGARGGSPPAPPAERPLHSPPIPAFPPLRGKGELPIQGYASLFWKKDLNDDVVAAGAFDASLARTPPGRVRMLMQHDPLQPIGVWDVLAADATGLFVRGRIIAATPGGRMAMALAKAGALDGLSIGFRAVKARAGEGGRLRVLTEVDLWEISLVTFPMLPGARLSVEAEPA